jgi:nicotinate-nucleotide adenylyltransferase
MSRVGIYGGNFDPVHNGHLITAMKVREERNLDRIIFIPAHISPFKTEGQSALPHHRINMLKLAINAIPFFGLSDIEIQTGGISYTIDTLRKLKNDFDMELIIGFDNLAAFTSWKDPDEILKIAKIIVLNRNVNETTKSTNRFFEHAVFSETPLIEISSTEIRNRVRNDMPIDFLVPEDVKKYIIVNKLYKD